MYSMNLCVQNVQAPMYSMNLCVQNVQAPMYSMNLCVQNVQAPMYSMNLCVQNVQAPTVFILIVIAPFVTHKAISTFISFAQTLFLRFRQFCQLFRSQNCFQLSISFRR
jgi:hypothetical protein